MARFRNSASAASLIDSMAFVAKYTVPLVGVSSAASKCSKVLLPAPDGATIATISPCRKLKFASARTQMLFSPLPYVFFRPRDSSTTTALRGSSDATPASQPDEEQLPGQFCAGL